MRYALTLLASSALILGSCLGLTGCARTRSGAPTAAPVTVTVSYGDAEAQATILVTSPTGDGIRDQILSLGEALEKAAQSPQPLFSYLKKSQ